MITRKKLRKWHIYLGWMVAIPMLFWIVSGILMVWKPIDEVRGRDLLRPEAPVRMSAPPVTPVVAGVPLSGLKLESRASGPRWVVGLDDGHSRLADPATGQWLPPLSARDAAAEVEARYAGKSRIASVSATDADNPPLELRRPQATWAVSMADGTRFFVDRNNGAIIATRTPFWRVYDFMWGLHIMDSQTREEPHNPLTLGFGFISLGMLILGLILLPLAIPPRRGRKSAED